MQSVNAKNNWLRLPPTPPLQLFINSIQRQQRIQHGSDFLFASCQNRIVHDSWLGSLCNTLEVFKRCESESLLPFQIHLHLFILFPVQWCDLVVVEMLTVEALQLRNVQVSNAFTSCNRCV